MTEKRLKTLLANALSVIESEVVDFIYLDKEDKIKWFRNEVGITKEELKEIEFI